MFILMADMSYSTYTTTYPVGFKKVFLEGIIYTLIDLKSAVKINKCIETKVVKRTQIVLQFFAVLVHDLM